MSRHCEYLRRETVGEPYTGNPSVRFDEGHGLTPVPTLLSPWFKSSSSGAKEEETGQVRMEGSRRTAVYVWTE